MTEVRIDEKTAIRIKKFLDLAKSTTHEGEANQAMERAQALMLANNVTMAELEANTGRIAEGGKREKASEIGKALYTYQRNLMKGLAELNFCLCWVKEYSLETYQEAWDAGRTKPKTRLGYILIGRESNIINTREMFAYLNEVFERLVPITNNAERLSKKALSWKEGCADRVLARLNERAREAKQTDETRVREARAASQHPSSPTSSGGLVVSLVDIAQQEEDFNNDIRYGYEPGTTAQNRLEAPLRRAAYEESVRVKALSLAEDLRTKPDFSGISEEMLERLARLLASGWDLDGAKIQCGLTPGKKETDRQKEERLEKEARQRQRWNEQYQRERDREAKRLDHGAYRAGSSAGNTVNLDKQMTAEEKKRLN